MSVVGYGRAEKSQVQMMVRSLLGLAEAIESLEEARKRNYFVDGRARKALTDKDWDYLRTRSEFQKFLSDLKVVRAP